MKLLLDTHVWIWAFEGSRALGSKCRRILVSADNERWVSPISTLEIARLVDRGIIELVCPMSEWLVRSIKALKLRTLEIDHATAIEAYTLPGEFHADPADRLLVAAARVHGLKLVTADRKILSYGGVDSMSAKQ